MNLFSFSALNRPCRFLLAGLVFLFAYCSLVIAANPYDKADTYKALAELLEQNPPAAVALPESVNGSTPVAASLQELREQIQKLTLYLKNSGKVGAKWSAILKLPELTAEANKATPDLVKLEDILAQFQSHLWGLEVEVLQNTGNCLKDYIGLRILVEDKVDMSNAIQTVLPDLIKTLKQADSGSFQSAQELNAFLLWANQYRQMSDVCAQIRVLACRNNLSIYLSDNFVSRYMNRPVNRVISVQETIQGVPQRGTMKIVGTNNFKLIPSEDKIGLQLNFSAKGEGTARGYAERGVQIQSNAVNNIQASKNIYFNGSEFTVTPATANVAVSSTVTGISAPSPVVQRAAQNRIAESRAAANQEATIKAQRRTVANIDQEVAQFTQQASKRLRDFSLLYKERGIYPSPLKCVSGRDHVLIEGFTERFFALCVQSRPEFGKDCDLRVSVHQSMFIEFSKGLLADLRANEKTFLTIAQSMLPPKAFAKLDKAAQERRQKNLDSSNEELLQGYMYFNAQFPVKAEFKDGKIYIALRVDGFQSDLKKKVQDIPMNISACYKPELAKDEQGQSIIRFTLQDGVEFVPRDFETQTRSMTKPETTLRNRMGDTIERLFPKDFVIETSDMMVKGSAKDSASEKVGRMVPVAVDARDGWLQIGWKTID